MAEKKPKKKYDPEESIRKREETARKRREAALRNKALQANQAKPARALPTPAARVAPAVGQRALGMLGGAAGLGASGMMYSPPADAPTLYDPSLIPGPANPRREQTAGRMLADPYGFARGPQAARIPPRQLQPPPPMMADYFSGDIQDAQALRAQMQAELAQLYGDEIGQRYQPTGEDLLNAYPMDAGMTQPRITGEPPPPMLADLMARMPAQETPQRQARVARPRQVEPPPPMLTDLFERMPEQQQQLPQQAAPEQRQQRSLNPVLNAALGIGDFDMDLSGAFEPGMAEDIELAEQFTPEGGMSPYEFGQDYLNPAGMSAHEFGQEYLNPLLTSAPTGYSYLQNTLGRGIADLMRGAAGYEQLPEEQELIEAVDRPDLAQQQLAAPEPGTAQGITRTPADPFEQQRIALIEEYMQGQQQSDPRQRQIMGSADEFAANQPPPRMSQQQLEAALMQLAREESMQATDPFAGYDESLFPEQFVEDGRPRGVTVDPVTGVTSFEGGQRYPRDAELTGRDSMDDLRLGTEYTSRALRNLGRARGVPSPQEIERKRMLSTLGGDAQGQGYRADELADQMRRTRSGLNAANLTPLELEAGRSQLETLGAELAAARGGAEQARRLQLQGTMQPVPPAPEDIDLQQLREAETARTQAEAVAEQRRALEELRIGGRNQVGARDMQQYTEMFSAMEPSAVPEGMPLSALDEDMQLQEQGRINRIQLATTLASSHAGFRTQPALAMEAARLLSTLRGDPKTQTAFMNVILEAAPEELGQVLQELYDELGGP